MNASSDMRGELNAGAALIACLIVSSAVAAEDGDATPRLADGRIDLNGTWGAVPGANPVTQDLGDGGICIYGCESRDRTPPDRPVYRAEFQATVTDLEAR